MAEKKDTRRAVLTGGAVLLGAAVVGSEGTAEAANGSAVLAGRTTNAASAETRLTSSGNAAGLKVITSNAGGGAIALYAAAKGGYGAYVESTSNIGASIWSKHKDKYGVVAVNSAATKGTGGAVRADGRQNIGLFATTANKAATAITGRNTGAAALDLYSSAVIGTVGPTADAQLQDVQSTYLHGAGGFAGANGVVGVATVESGAGVVGVCRHRYGAGVYAAATGEFGFSLYTSGTAFMGGDVSVNGTLSKAAGSFKIDHPLDPANKYLSHSFVESPDMMNVYNGNATADANGEATVELPEWFGALNKDFRYQLTPIGGAAPDLHVKTEVADNAFALAGAKPGQRISWQLTGIRQDAYAKAHRIPVEHAKPVAEKGKYVFPKGFGKPDSAGLDHLAAQR